MKKNDQFDTEILDMNSLGFGIAKIGGMAVFVFGAVCGDLARIRIIKVEKKYAVARTEAILSPSPHRVDDVCPVSAACGGCAFRSVSYDYEKAQKKQAVRMSFQRQGMPDVPIAPLTSTGVQSHYRNKGQYPVRRGKDGGIEIGFFAAKSHRVLPCLDCDLADERFAPILSAVKNFMEEYAVPAYDEASGEGLVRHIYLRAGKATGQIMLCLVLTKPLLPHADEFVASMRAAFPDVVSIWLNENGADTNVVLGERFTLLCGEPTIEDILCGVRLCIPPAAFYQVNRDAAELLYEKAAELARLSGGETLLDLYCGIGSIGLSMARAAKKVIGVEVVPAAIECAKKNAKLNGIENAEFFCGDAAEVTTARGFTPDVVLLDPPRKGCAGELIDFLCEKEIPRIVYISCNPETLARDAKQITARGYTMGEIFPFDLFSRTGHVECVTVFERG